MRTILTILATWAMMTCMLFAHSAVYPRPQLMRMAEGKLDLSGGVALQTGTFEDADSLARLKEILYQAGIATSGEIPLRIGLQGDSLPGSNVDEVKGVSGAYRLEIADGGITLVGRDDRGVFYGVQTLSQLLEGTRLPKLSLHDFPDIPYRGTVEGFYGKPWEHEDRIREMRFYGQNIRPVRIASFGRRIDTSSSVLYPCCLADRSMEP